MEWEWQSGQRVEANVVLVGEIWGEEELVFEEGKSKKEEKRMEN